MTKTIDITPNFAHLFAMFIEQARTQGLHITRYLPLEEVVNKPATLAAVLRGFEGPIVALNIAASAMTTAEEVEQLRSVLSELASYLDQTAGRLEKQAEGEDGKR
jgi:hypothetical protein